MRFGRVDLALLARRLRFIALNAAAVGLLVGLVIVPFASHVSQLCEDISERAEQLARLQHFKQAAQQNQQQLDKVFFAAAEERLASADLHAMLKTLTQEGGLQLMGLRSVAPRQPIAKRSIAVAIEVEGAAAKLRDTLVKIESARPVLVVTGAKLRPSSPESEAVLRAELVIQGALRPLPSRAALLEAGG